MCASLGDYPHGPAALTIMWARVRSLSRTMLDFWEPPSAALQTAVFIATGLNDTMDATIQLELWFHRAGWVASHREAPGRTPGTPKSTNCAAEVVPHSRFTT